MMINKIDDSIVPTATAARLMWYKRELKRGYYDREALAWAVYDSSRRVLAEKEANAPPVEPEYLKNIEPGFLWRRIENNTQRNYITATSALNLIDNEFPGGGDWHSAGWSFPTAGVDPALRDCRHAQATGVYYHETWESLGAQQVVDVRQPLRLLGHPAGQRPQPVWGARHPRAIIDHAWHWLSRSDGELRRHVTPYEVARWLQDEQQLADLVQMANRLAEQVPVAHLDRWLVWRDCLSIEAVWRDSHDAFAARM